MSKYTHRLNISVLAICLILGLGQNVQAQFQENFDSENNGAGSLNYNFFLKFNVTRGNVDLIGNGFFDFYPGNGLYVDMAGTSGEPGVLESDVEFPPAMYQLSFRIGNNWDNPDTNSLLVQLGNYSETFQRTGIVEIQLVERTIELQETARLILETPISETDFSGIIIDEVSVKSGFLLGDVNTDGVVNLLDVGPFVELLTNGGFQFEADINGDGSVDLLDVGPFVDLLSG